MRKRFSHQNDKQKATIKQNDNRAEKFFTYKASKVAENAIKSFVGTRSIEFPSKRKFWMLCGWLSVMLSKFSIAL